MLPKLSDYSHRELANMVGVDHRTIDRLYKGQAPRNALRVSLTRIAATLDETTP